MRAKLNSTFDEIEALKTSILTDFDQLSIHQLTFKPNSRKWSLLQVIEHLMLAETGSINYVNKKLLDPTKLEEYSFKAAFRFKLLQSVFALPLKIRRRPATADPTLEPDLKDVKLRWDIARKALRKFLDAYDDVILKKLVYKHPFAGRINALQMTLFFKLHIKHHQKQIERIKKHRNYPNL